MTNGESGAIDASQRVEKAGQQDHCRVLPSVVCRIEQNSAGASAPRSAERGLSNREIISRRYAATFRRTRLVSPRNVQPALRRHVRGENSRMIGKTSSRPASMARESSSLDAGE